MSSSVIKYILHRIQLNTLFFHVVTSPMLVMWEKVMYPIEGPAQSYPKKLKLFAMCKFRLI